MWLTITHNTLASPRNVVVVPSRNMLSDVANKNEQKDKTRPTALYQQYVVVLFTRVF